VIFVILIGFILILIGLFLFFKATYKILKAFTVRFWGEKQMDRYLFKMWQKEKDYQNFKNNIK